MSDDGTQHPLKIYWIMWISLFVLSSFSYATDFMDDGALRHFLILLFMFAKAGGIVWIFMHMGWERMALKLAILGPPVAIIVLISWKATISKVLVLITMAKARWKWRRRGITKTITRDKKLYWMRPALRAFFCPDNARAVRISTHPESSSSRNFSCR